MYSGLRRVAVPSQARTHSSIKSLPAPVAGWVEAANLASPPKLSAKLVENWFPTQTGYRIRGGSAKVATLTIADPDTDTDALPVDRLFPYIGASSRLFAADENNIYDLSSVPDVDTELTPVVTGRTSGYYSTSLFTTSGGTYLTAVNGADLLLIYDGTYWLPMNDKDVLQINYDAQTGNFHVGNTLTGGTSGATGTILQDIDGGTTGTLIVRKASGTFQNDETITDGSGGSATSNIPTGAVTLASGISSVATSLLSAVWVYKNRQYFIEGGTLRAHYLGTDSIGGSLATISLYGIFKRGGSLLFGATWSLDAGDGIDDKCVFVTDQGEVAVYQGDDPSADNWSLVGRYDITAPLGKNGTMQAGGDLLLLVEAGVVPISAAIKKDQAALSLSAVSRRIQPAWQQEVQRRSGAHWEIAKWPSHSMALVTLPISSLDESPYSFIVNLETGAWTKYTGWDARCVAVFNDRLYFGTTSGTVVEGEVGGSDQGSPFTAQLVYHADALDSPGITKTVKAARSTFLASRPFNPRVSVSTNYKVVLPVAPNAVEDTDLEGWDAGTWDNALWDATAAPASVSTQWRSIGRTGYAINVQVQVTSANLAARDCELVSVDLLYERGAAVMV